MIYDTLCNRNNKTKKRQHMKKYIMYSFNHFYFKFLILDRRKKYINHDHSRQREYYTSTELVLRL